MTHITRKEETGVLLLLPKLVLAKVMPVRVCTQHSFSPP